MIDFLMQNSEEIEKRLGYTFKDKKLLLMAFVHRSFFNEHRTAVEQHNERLEFLGDAVMGLIVSDYLFTYLPHHPEGELSHIRSSIVDAGACVHYLHKLGVGEYVLLGRGEKMNEGRGRETIYADLFEALMGAIFLDGGIEAATHFFLSHFKIEIEALLKEPSQNWKAELQDYSQKKYQRPPLYRVLKESGPDHHKIFEVSVSLADQEMGIGLGSSKKQAEQAAAQAALKKLLP